MLVDYKLKILAVSGTIFRGSVFDRKISLWLPVVVNLK